MQYVICEVLTGIGCTAAAQSWFLALFILHAYACIMHQASSYQI